MNHMATGATLDKLLISCVSELYMSWGSDYSYTHRLLYYLVR